ncbi:MAG: hypothetical protein ACK4QL_03435 [Pseudanabaenaceae cyanobacterium]
MDTNQDELYRALHLATDEELDQIAAVLFKRQFNPLDYLIAPPVEEVQSKSRAELIDAIAERFKFLAADGLTVLRGKAKQIPYRMVLEKVCRYLKVKYKQTQTVQEIESELFLHLIERSWRNLTPSEQEVLAKPVEGELPQKDKISLLVKGGTALAITRLRSQIATILAKRTAVTALGQYAALRTILGVLTPTLWGLFFADLGWRTIATNYSRIIPVIFIIAQIRLLREL